MSYEYMTPGPWRFEQSQGGRWYVYGAAESQPVKPNVYVPKNGGTKQAFANARLMAAAPELLKALEHMVAVSNWATTIQSEEQYDAMIANAEAAIRKAKGEVL